MQLSRVSLQAFMTLSAPRTVCCSSSAELVELALCLKVVDLYVQVFFWSQSAAPLLCACSNGELQILQCFRNGEREKDSMPCQVEFSYCLKTSPRRKQWKSCLKAAWKQGKIVQWFFVISVAWKQRAGNSASMTGNLQGNFQDLVIAYMEIGQIILQKSSSQLICLLCMLFPQSVNDCVIAKVYIFGCIVRTIILYMLCA